MDVDWLNDYAFASAGADKVVHIMQLGNPDPLRTYKYVFPLKKF